MSTDAGLPAGALSADAAATGDAFVRVGLELEELTVVGPVSGPVVVGLVREITELTEFKKPIRYCHVDIGSARMRLSAARPTSRSGTASPSQPLAVCCRATSSSPPGRPMVTPPTG